MSISEAERRNRTLSWTGVSRGTGGGGGDAEGCWFLIVLFPRPEPGLSGKVCCVFLPLCSLKRSDSSDALSLSSNALSFLGMF